MKALKFAALLAALSLPLNVSALVIEGNATGGDCASVGVWNASTRTCVLTQNLSEPVVISDNNITLDGSGHRIGTTGSNTLTGIRVDSVNVTTVKNVVVSGFETNIDVFSSNDTILENIRNENALVRGVNIFASNDTSLENVRSEKSLRGVNIFASSGVTFHRNTFANNGVATVIAGGSGTVAFTQNNFLNNGDDIQKEDGSNVSSLSRPLPEGGNHWSRYDAPDEGCNDANADGFCDAPYSPATAGTADQFPWVKENGWGIPRGRCLGQETTVVFMNGVWTTKDEAEQHSKVLERESRKVGISPACTRFDYSHTQDDTKSQDVVEALIQKSNELHVPLLTMVRAFFALFVLDAKMTLAIDDVIVSEYQDTITIIDTQLEKHLKKFKDVSLNLGRRGVAVTHSQGGLYGNALFGRLNLTERANTRLVTVATPAENAADGGPNTVLLRDGVVNRFFLAASAEWLIRNTDRLCDKEAEARPNSWPCHGFETGYLHDLRAREQIVDDVTKALPGATVRGVVRNSDETRAGEATVSLFSSSGVLIAETIARSITATYRFGDIQVPCSACFLKAKSSSGTVCGTAPAPMVLEGLYVIDVTLDESC